MIFDCFKWKVKKNKNRQNFSSNKNNGLEDTNVSVSTDKPLDNKEELFQVQNQFQDTSSILKRELPFCFRDDEDFNFSNSMKGIQAQCFKISKVGDVPNSKCPSRLSSLNRSNNSNLKTVKNEYDTKRFVSNNGDTEETVWHRQVQLSIQQVEMMCHTFDKYLKPFKSLPQFLDVISNINMEFSQCIPHHDSNLEHIDETYNEQLYFVKETRSKIKNTINDLEKYNTFMQDISILLSRIDEKINVHSTYIQHRFKQDRLESHGITMNPNNSIIPSKITHSSTKRTPLQQNTSNPSRMLSLSQPHLVSSLNRNQNVGNDHLFIQSNQNNKHIYARSNSATSKATLTNVPNSYLNSLRMTSGYRNRTRRKIAAILSDIPTKNDEKPPWVTHL